MHKRDNTSLAPVVLFVYNRPEHTLKTLQALNKNALAEQSTLIIYADGPKPKSTSVDYEKIKQTRQVIRQQHWCKETIIHESEINRGLADSIVSGVTQTVNQYGKVIVLEDDIVTSQGFLQYMNDALNLYEDEEKVMHISGYIFPVETKLPATFFYNTASCWGWGTWQRAWQYFSADALQLSGEIKSKNLVHQFNVENSYPFFEQLLKNANKTIKTWAVKWYASFFLQNGYSLHPYPSLTNNIGSDGTGANSGTHNIFSWSYLADHIEVQKIAISESKRARQAVWSFYKKKLTKKKKKQNMLISIVSRLVPYRIKHWIKLTFNENYRKAYEEKEKLRTMPRYVETTVHLFDGEIRIPDVASFLFMRKEIFQQEIYKFNPVTDTPFIIDCGANIGLSVIYFKRLFPKASIIAFEPDDNIFAILKHNIQVFNLEQVQLVKKAVWNKEAILQFFAEGADGGRIAQANDTNEKSIEAVRLRNYLNRRIDFLKIDIEGAETEVIEDCHDLLHLIDHLFIEYHSFSEKEQTLDKILTILRETGFRYYVDAPGLKSKHPFVKVNESLGMDMQLNIYAIRIIQE